MEQRQRRVVYPRAALRRIAYGLTLIAAVMIVGIVGFRELAHLSLVDSFYEESMIATGQGPTIELNSDAAKIFASLMAFVSVGSVITTLFFTLAPVLAVTWREVIEHLEVEAKKVEEDLAHKKKQEPRNEDAPS